MGFDQIGLEAIFQNDKFQAGLAEYIKGLGTAEKDTTSKAKGISGLLSGIGKAAGGMAVAVAGAAVAGIAGLAVGLSQTIGPASDLNETISKVGVVFGTSADQVLAFGDKAAKALGMSKNEALTAAGTYGNLFRSMGMTNETSADMSTNLVKLAGDLASFNNQSPAEVLDKLRAGLTGETEPLKSLGVNLSADAVAAKAMSMGLVKATVNTTKLKEAQLAAEKEQIQYDWVTKNFSKDSRTARLQVVAHEKAQKALQDAMAGSADEITASAKAQATYALIMEQTSLAQGDFARTSGGLANQQRIFAAQTEDLKAKIGTALLPSINQLMLAFTNFLDSPEIQAGLQTLATWLATNLPVAISTAATYWSTVLWPALQTVWAWIQGSLIPTIQVIWAWLANNVPAAVQTLATFWSTVLLPALQAVGNWISTVLTPMWQAQWNWLSVNLPLAIQTFLVFWNTILWPALMTVWGWINTFLIPLFQAFGELFSVILTLAVQGFASLWTSFFQPALDTTGGFLNSTLIPAFQSLWSWLAEKLTPILKTVADFLGYTVVNALRTLEGFINSVINAVHRLAKALSSLVIPKALSPGSPTPFEIGLRGVNDAIKQVTAALTPLQMNLNAAGASSGMTSMAAGPTPAASVTNVSNVFNMGGQNINNGWDVASLQSFILKTVSEAL